ncbi:hypothetical protein C8R44DRAFT_885458 [Mycena epipterygia]|nr:hypothetical protein C8R44DRAFT_885458 [Mycena epipterygia]
MPHKHSPPTTTMPAHLQKGEAHLALDGLVLVMHFDPHVIQYDPCIPHFDDVGVATDDGDDEIPELLDLEEDPQPCCRHCPTCHPLATV